MIKKIAHWLRLLLILICWTILYFYLVSLIFNLVWHFNIFKKSYWIIIGNFWNSGGIIDQFSEYMFLLMLILIVPMWIYGFKKAKDMSYIKLFFFPIFWYRNYMNRKYAVLPEHIVLKNINSGKGQRQSPQQMMEELIAARMPSATPTQDLNSNKIRSSFEKKNKNFHKKMDESNK